jgi:hypothetical protein
MTPTWRIHTEGWSQLPAATRRDYAIIVGSYGGNCDYEGHGEFRKYSRAEICAHTLEHRLGIRTSAALFITPSASRTMRLHATA